MQGSHASKARCRLLVPGDNANLHHGSRMAILGRHQKITSCRARRNWWGPAVPYSRRGRLFEVGWYASSKNTSRTPTARRRVIKGTQP